MTTPAWAEERAREIVEAWAHGVLLRDDFQEFAVPNHEDLVKQISAALVEVRQPIRVREGLPKRNPRKS